MKRVFDIFLGCLAALILFVPVLLVAMAVRLTSKGPVLYWSDRVGRNNVIFKMPKFRSMRVGTPAVATHLLADARLHLTPIGSFLRKSSLDELPQLWSILAGHMEEAAVMMVGLEVERVRQGLAIVATQARGAKRDLRPVGDYSMPNVSAKVVRIIHSYTDYVNRVVWLKSN